MIRPMIKNDIPRVAEIQVFAYRTTDRGILSDEFLFNTMTVASRMDYFNDLLQCETDESYVFDDGIVKGFITFVPSKDWQLSSIYVDTFFQRTGVGAELMVFFEKSAAKRNSPSVCLWVLEKNNIARNFYEKLGYSPNGETSTGGLGTVEIKYIKQTI